MNIKNIILNRKDGVTLINQPEIPIIPCSPQLLSRQYEEEQYAKYNIQKVKKITTT